MVQKDDLFLYVLECNIYLQSFSFVYFGYILWQCLNEEIIFFVEWQTGLKAPYFLGLSLIFLGYLIFFFFK